MAFDIYGGDLLPGHCEAHPHVHEEYPCSICMMENQKRRSDKLMQQKAYDEQYEYYANMEAQHYAHKLIGFPMS